MQVHCWAFIVQEVTMCSREIYFVKANIAKMPAGDHLLLKAAARSKCLN